MKNFKYSVNGRKYYVGFKSFDDKIVKCYFHDLDIDKIFVGIAKLNTDDGDEFDLAEGERTAFEKATDKRCQYFSNLVIRITNELFTQERSDDYSLSKKFEREQKKFYECKELTPEEKGEYIPNMIDQADEIVEELKETLKIIKAEKNKIKD